MRISEMHGRGRPIFSFEFFPPKSDEQVEPLLKTIADLKSALQPNFVSVTNGAGGSTRERHQRHQQQQPAPEEFHQIHLNRVSDPTSARDHRGAAPSRRRRWPSPRRSWDRPS